MREATVNVVRVEHGTGRYDVMVGAGVRRELPSLVADAVPAARRAAVVTQAGIGVDVDPGLPTSRIEVKPAIRV